MPGIHRLMQEPFSSGPHSFPEENRLDYLISQDTRQSLNIMAVAVGHCRVDAPRIQEPGLGSLGASGVPKLWFRR